MLRTRAHDLSEGELERLVSDLAADPDRWRHLVTHRPDERTYAELHRDEHVAIWLICWMNDHDTGYHDHDLSAGAVGVAAGAGRGERGGCGGGGAGAAPGAGGGGSLPGGGHPPRHATRPP